ncbi:serine protease [Patescibacteria group bacterium]|nr:MAG: serine protease [Patescibacteria group bacterium]
MAKIKKRRRADNSRDLVSRPRPTRIKAKHTKPYRRRHLLLLGLALLYLLLLTFQIGVMVGRGRQQSAEPIIQQITPKDTQKTVTSTLGVRATYDTTLFTVSATALDDKGAGHAVASQDLHTSQDINYVVFKPRPTAISAPLVASQLSVQILPDTAPVTEAQRASPNASTADIAQKLLPVTASADFDITALSHSTEVIGDGTSVRKTMYQFTPKFDGDLSYAVAWHGTTDGRAFVIKLSGLTSSSAAPEEYTSLLDALVLNSSAKVRGVSNLWGNASAAQSLSEKYVPDLVSPAVVKIYNIVCGELVISDKNYGYACDGATGSGFILTQDGYIATNGHVVVLTAKDIMVKLLTADPETFAQFLQLNGYSDEQVRDISQDSQKVASVITKIYDLPDKTVHLKQSSQIVLVALGEEPLRLAKDQKLQDLLKYRETDEMKTARVVDYDYDAKDLWVAQSGSADGFAYSDVALLKVELRDAPTIAVTKDPTNQSEKVTVLGFPGDAENVLVDNSTLDVSVTSGTVSAVKEAAGGNGKLYQSDADASHGNSGGPAVNDSGEVFGLLTYRLSGDTQGNAAKSYIRDINDLTDLADERAITLDGSSTTQEAWRRGLDLYSHNHFKAAQEEFKTVEKSYAPHRLVDQYVASTRKHIAAGDDVPVYSSWLVGAMALAGVVTVIVAIVLIVRHRVRHQMYLQHHKHPAPHPSQAPAAPTQSHAAPAPQPHPAQASLHKPAHQAPAPRIDQIHAPK